MGLPSIPAATAVKDAVATDPARAVELQPAASTILLVDDDLDLRALTGTYLQKKGYKVVSCNNAESAAKVMNSAVPIDLLITDVDMPERSGTDLSLEMNQARPSVPVLIISGGFLTGHAAEKVRQHGWKRLDKPFRLPQLLNTVHDLLNKPVDA